MELPGPLKKLFGKAKESPPQTEAQNPPAQELPSAAEERKQRIKERGKRQAQATLSYQVEQAKAGKTPEENPTPETVAKLRVQGSAPQWQKHEAAKIQSQVEKQALEETLEAKPTPEEPPQRFRRIVGEGKTMEETKRIQRQRQKYKKKPQEPKKTPPFMPGTKDLTPEKSPA